MRKTCVVLNMLLCVHSLVPFCETQFFSTQGGPTLEFFLQNCPLHPPEDFAGSLMHIGRGVREILKVL
jgi:hypothetical protein